MGLLSALLVSVLLAFAFLNGYYRQIERDLRAYADLILSGHYHGGVVRLSEHYGLSSPQYLFLPPFCCGDFHKGDQHMIVSAGLGEHTIPLRIHNPRELLVIDIKPSEKMK